MIKAGNMWIALERVTLAILDGDGDLLLYFGAEHRIRIPNEKKADKAKVIAALEQAPGYTPSAKESENEVVTFSGVDCEGRSWLGCREKEHPSEVKPPSGKTHLDLVRELSAVDLANLLIDGACPPSSSEDCCAHDDCVQCWVNWLEGSVDGDPHA